MHCSLVRPGMVEPSGTTLRSDHEYVAVASDDAGPPVDARLAKTARDAATMLAAVWFTCAMAALSPKACSMDANNVKIEMTVRIRDHGLGTI